MEKIVLKLNFLTNLLQQVTESLERLEHQISVLQVKTTQNADRVEKAMETCQKAFKCTSNAQLNLQEDLELYAGTTSHNMDIF